MILAIVSIIIVIIVVILIILAIVLLFLFPEGPDIVLLLKTGTHETCTEPTCGFWAAPRGIQVTYGVLAETIPQGPSTQYFRTLVPITISPPCCPNQYDTLWTLGEQLNLGPHPVRSAKLPWNLKLGAIDRLVSDQRAILEAPCEYSS